MTLSMHAIAVPVFQHMLLALDDILVKAGGHAAESGQAEAALLDARLAPDMLPFVRQVQIACDHAKGAVSRLSGREVPSFADEEASLAELRARIGRTLDVVASVGEAEMEGSETREVTIRAGQRELRFDGLTYLLHFALPNFFFHATTAYDILRSAGVPLGKADFLGAAGGAPPAWMRPT